jgi:hypothetical protein
LKKQFIGTLSSYFGKYVKEAFDNVNGKQKSHPELATISRFVKVI